MKNGVPPKLKGFGVKPESAAYRALTSAKKRRHTENPNP